MALLKFLKGDYAKLNNTAVAEGQILICNDTAEMFVDVAADKRIKIGDFTVVANLTALEALDATAVPTSRLYYVEDGNILARSNGTAWVQVNKQPTPAELKTLLGLGSMAYVSEVAEANLSAELAAKVNAVDTAKHTHDNKDVIDGITAAKVTAWDAAEGNAKTYADGLNTAMNTRVEALEAVDHEHANKALLDTYTQTEANLADAVAKKHAHTFNETELNKIVEGDVAKWNGVAADHLTSADKTTLENAIKEAKKAGTDANTALETYKVTNDARVLAVEEDIAEITNAENGVLAQAKAYSDGKLATARTEITAEIDADVKVVSDALDAYKTSNNAALAEVKATADAAAVKTEVETALAGKVDKVEGKDLIATSEIERLATLHNYDDTAVKADIAKKADAETMTTELGKKVDKVEGYSLVADTEIARLANVDNYDDTALAGRVTTAEGKITALETASATHATKSEVEAVDAKFADYNTTVAQKAIDDAQDARIKAIEDDYLVEADIADFETKANVKKVADDLAAYVESNDAALAAETKARTDADAGFETRIATLESNFGEGEGTVDAKIAAAVAAEAEIARAAEKANADDIDALEGRMDTAEGKISALETESAKHAVKTEVEAALALKADKSVVDAMYTNEQIDAAILVETNRAKGVEESLQTQINTIINNPDAEGAINSINEFTQYITDHGTIADGFRTDIDKNKEDIATNAQAIADETSRATGAEEALGGRIDELKAAYDAHTHSWNDLTDKPFEDSTSIEWDGNTEGRDTFSGAYKVSEYIDKDSFVGATVNFRNGATVTISEDQIAIVDDQYGRGFSILDVIYANEMDIDGKVGVYFDSSVASVVFPAKTLDDKYISSNIARTADVNASVTALDGRVATLEAIDHDAYVAADTALKTELNAEIAKKADTTTVEAMDAAYKAADAELATAVETATTTAATALATAKTELEGKITDGDAATLAAAKEDAAAKVKELAEGAVATNAANIAALLEQLTWGSFAE